MTAQESFIAEGRKLYQILLNLEHIYQHLEEWGTPEAMVESWRQQRVGEAMDAYFAALQNHDATLPREPRPASTGRRTVRSWGGAVGGDDEVDPNIREREMPPMGR